MADPSIVALGRGVNSHIEISLDHRLTAALDTNILAINSLALGHLQAILMAVSR
jgi:hypothetical protein